MAPHDGVFEHAPTLRPVARCPRDVVDRSVGKLRDDRRIGEVVHRRRTPVAAAPFSMRPVAVATVAGTDVESDKSDGVDIDDQRFAGRRGQVDTRTRDALFPAGT